MVRALSGRMNRIATRILALVVATGVLTGCGLTGSRDHGPQTGHALKEAGYAMRGTLTIGSASPGHVYGFALDLLYNASKSPITFESARVDSIPAGLRFVKMGLYDTNETDGTVLGGTDTDWQGSAKTGTDYGRFPNHYNQAIVIKPGSEVEPSYYPVVFVRFESKQKETITMKDCTIFYKQGSTHYKQDQHCQFKITSQNSPDG